MNDNLANRNKKISIILVLLTIVLVSILEFIMTLLCPTKNCFSYNNMSSDTLYSVSSNYKTYDNPRFEFSLKYPDSFTEEAHSDEGEGITLKTSDKNITIRIWGSNNTHNETPRILYEKNLKNSNNVTHKYLVDNYYIIDETDEKDNYCKYSIVGPGSINNILIKYPKNLEDDLQILIKDLINSFTPGDLSTSH